MELAWSPCKITSRMTSKGPPPLTTQLQRGEGMPGSLGLPLLATKSRKPVASPLAESRGMVSLLDALFPQQVPGIPRVPLLVGLLVQGGPLDPLHTSSLPTRVRLLREVLSGPQGLVDAPPGDLFHQVMSLHQLVPFTHPPPPPSLLAKKLPKGPSLTSLGSISLPRPRRPATC